MQRSVGPSYGGVFGVVAADLAGLEALTFHQMTEPFPAMSLHRGLGARDMIVAREGQDAEIELEVGRESLRKCARTEGQPMFEALDVLGRILAYGALDAGP